MAISSRLIFQVSSSRKTNTIKQASLLSGGGLFLYWSKMTVSTQFWQFGKAFMYKGRALTCLALATALLCMHQVTSAQQSVAPGVQNRLSDLFSKHGNVKILT